MSGPFVHKVWTALKRGVAMVGLRVMPSLPDLTAEERAAIRQACGFACVRCGVTIYRYLGLPDGRAGHCYVLPVTAWSRRGG